MCRHCPSTILTCLVLYKTWTTEDADEDHTGSPGDCPYCHVVLSRDANTGSTSTPARTAQPTVVSPIQQLVNTSHEELNITTEDATINDDVDNNNNNISNPGDVVVTEEMRPTQSQGHIPELNPPTPEHQHARRDRRHHDDQRNVPPPPEPVVTDMSYAAAARDSLRPSTTTTVITECITMIGVHIMLMVLVELLLFLAVLLIMVHVMVVGKTMVIT